MKYVPRDWAAWRAARDAAILAGAPVLPHGECNMCGWEVPKGALWCATACAREFEAHRKELVKDSPTP